jgi:hypothetical protein
MWVVTSTLAGHEVPHVRLVRHCVHVLFGVQSLLSATEQAGDEEHPDQD